MSFNYQQRSSDSVLVETIWQTEDEANGTYLAAADGAWDLIFTKEAGRTRVLLSGPNSVAKPVKYKQGNQNIGIRFKPGVFMNHLSTLSMVNNSLLVYAIPNRGFVFNDSLFEVPTFENADDFIKKLVNTNTLKHSSLTFEALNGANISKSLRTVQRHFLQSVGLTPQYMRLINKANKAVKKLQEGRAILEVSNELGFADQSHMTRVIKQVSGRTPGEIVRRVEECRLRSIQGYGPCGEMKIQNFTGDSYGYKTLQNQNSKRGTQ